MKEKTNNRLPKPTIGNPDGQFAVHDPQRLKINCFYKCSFITSESKAMEKHYRKEHYLKSKEVFHG